MSRRKIRAGPRKKKKHKIPEISFTDAVHSHLAVVRRERKEKENQLLINAILEDEDDDPEISDYKYVQKLAQKLGWSAGRVQNTVTRTMTKNPPKPPEEEKEDEESD